MAELQRLSTEISPEPPIEPSLSNNRGSASVESSLSRNLSSGRLNAQAAEFVPRSPVPKHTHLVPPPPHLLHIFHPPPMAAFYHRPVIRPHVNLEYYGRDGARHREPNAGSILPDSDPPVLVGGLPEDVTQRITKQVEYYFSDANLATTEHLMRFINKDPEGYVPISVIAAFKKIKTLVSDADQLATVLRTSSKLVVCDNGKKVKRLQPITSADIQELQSRIVVAENLPEDHCYQSLLKIFSAVGSVKTIRTCYPQTPASTASAATRHAKSDTSVGNKLHAFVEYETVEDADKAVAELDDEKNWRTGLRVRLLSSKREEAEPTSQHREPSPDRDREAGPRCGRGRCRGRGQARAAAARLPPGPRMPDGTKGFSLGRGRPVNAA
ncbi:la-related protein 6B-like isoform X2 [Wolffia australiana]